MQNNMEEKAKQTKIEDKKEIKRELNPAVWNVPYNADLLTQVIYIYRNNERKNTLAVKSRGDVSGGGKKPWKQKGTGRARQGSSRSPLWVGGGVTFGNAGEKNFSRKLNKKMARKAVCVMLSERLKEGNLEFVPMNLEFAEKTRKNLKNSVDARKTLIISSNEDIQKKLKNSDKAKVITGEKVNAQHLVWSNFVYVDEDIISTLEKRLTNGK